MASAGSAPPSPLRTVDVLEADPDLTVGIAEDELEAAHRHALARVFELRPHGPDVTAIDAGPVGPTLGLGLLVLDGLMIRRVTVGRRGACELFGPGDLLRPSDTDGEYDPLPVAVSWRVMQRTSVALLNDAFASRVSPWPSISSHLLGRVARRARYLTLSQAACHLPRVHARLLILFWLLGERFGRINERGVRIELPLTHELLAMLVGAQRPSVTVALGRLEASGLLTREGSGRWLLTHRAVERLADPDSLRLLRDAQALEPDRPGARR